MSKYRQQWEIILDTLEVIRDNQDNRISQIGRKANLTQSVVDRIIQPMIAKGWVTSETKHLTTTRHLKAKLPSTFYTIAPLGFAAIADLQTFKRLMEGFQ